MLVGYGRTLPTDQDPVAQVGALHQAGCELVFVDVGKDRPQRDAALNCLEPGDTLVVLSLDKLARSLRELLRTVDDLKTRGIFLRSLVEDIDTSTGPTCRLFCAISSFQRSIIIETAGKGSAEAKRRGKLGGRPRKLSAERLEEARKMLAAGESVSEVARTMGVSRATVHRAVATKTQ